MNSTANVPVKPPDVRIAPKPNPNLRVLLYEIVAGAGLGLLATLGYVALSLESAVRSQQTGFAFALYGVIALMAIPFCAVAVPVVCFMAQVFWQIFNPKK